MNSLVNVNQIIHTLLATILFIQACTGSFCGYHPYALPTCGFGHPTAGYYGSYPGALSTGCFGRRPYGCLEDKQSVTIPNIIVALLPPTSKTCVESSCGHGPSSLRGYPPFGIAPYRRPFISSCGLGCATPYY